jgi:hypothetical protein
MNDDDYDFEHEQMLARDAIESQAFDRQGFRKTKAAKGTTRKKTTVPPAPAPAPVAVTVI